MTYAFRVYNDPAERERAAWTYNAFAAVMTSRPPYEKVFAMFRDSPDWAMVLRDHDGAVFLRRGAGWDREIAERESRGR